jgi:hypothetical protein
VKNRGFATRLTWRHVPLRMGSSSGAGSPASTIRPSASAIEA